jgi:hypothetical protein
MIETKEDLNYFFYHYLSNYSPNDIILLYLNINFKKSKIVIDIDNLEEFVNTILPLYNNKLLLVSKKNGVFNFSKIIGIEFGCKDMVDN